MRWLSSNEADWERRHPVTLLFFLLLHLFIVTYKGDDLLLVIGLFCLLLLERRLPWMIVGLLLAFGTVSVFPVLIGWDISTSAIGHQLVKLAAFMFGMVWVSRYLRLERLLPLFTRWPRSSKLLYGAWALIPTMEQAIRVALRSHPKRAWRQALQVGVESQQDEPRFAVEPMRRFQWEDGLQLFLLSGWWFVAMNGPLVIWLLYPYLTKGGIRDALVVFRRWVR
ncbi:cornichon family protein [Exiguobacterium algae]|uniref:cornichon family protein n=1 Tax=Exiguobacterium algae TaxID=2751250 RepID=UPI001BE75B9D|nr:cornichon family protein [Exiguobacterium algae]